MTTARFAVIHAGPQVTVQDAGRTGLLRFGVPASGPMDRTAYRIANLALGNKTGTSAIEVSRGGLSLLCTGGEISFGTAGGSFLVALNGRNLGAWGVATIQKGDTLTIQPARWGSWCYLAFSGQLRCKHWLGSASTHGPSGLGGGALTTGADLLVDDAETRANRAGQIAIPVSARPRAHVRVVLGPQDRFFRPEVIRAMLTQPFTLSDAYDRMGVRLSGPSLRPDAVLDMPSEPIQRGSIQVAGDGVATVLLADHQTTGGYPKIATILSDDLDGFAQLRSHDQVRFMAIDARTAIAATRTRRMAFDRFAARWPRP